MATLNVVGTTDYTGLLLSNYDAIKFGPTNGFIVGTFTSDQFGAGEISKSVQLIGDSGKSAIQVNMSAPGTFDASNWTLTNWNGSDQVVIGTTAGNDIVHGTSGWDIIGHIDVAGGVDKLYGHGGDDDFRLEAGLKAGSVLDGGSGDDEIGLYTGAVTYDFRGTTIKSVEKLDFVSSGVAHFDASQIGSGGIGSIEGGLTDDVKLVVHGSNVDLSAVSFTDWTDLPLRVVIDSPDDVASKLTGSSVSDFIMGSSKSDLIAGGAGADNLKGNGGADVFQYTNAAELAAGEVIAGGDGVDTIKLVSVGAIDFSNATLSSIEAVDFESGGSSATLTSLQAYGIDIDGSTGADKLVVNQAGLTVDISGVTFTNWSASDVIILNGGAESESIIGSNRNDRIDGQAGINTLIGHGGDDTYYVDNSGDVVVEAVGGGWQDRVLASASYALAAGSEVEQLATTFAAGATAINLAGNEFAQTIVGNAGKNVLDGLGGLDTLNGGLGDDTYGLANGADTVVDTGGYDTISSTISRSLAGYADIEQLVLKGSDDINGTGNALANTIKGNDGNNMLKGAGGIDTLWGGLGDDTYVLEADADVVDDDGGYDTASSTVTRSLAGYADIERLVLDGSADINGTGNGLNNHLIGNDGKNGLWGGDGADRLTGGLGRDVFFGEAGGDRFDFNAIDETGADANTRDVIRDFVHGADTIDLATIDANGAAAGDVFSFLAAKGAAFTGVAGQLHWFQVDAANNAQDITVVEGDVNGDGVGDFQIGLTGLIALDAGDFSL